MTKVKPKLKTVINVVETIYHLYEYDAGYFGLFDNAGDGVPLSVGSKVIISSKLSEIQKHTKREKFKVIYYKQDSENVWKEYKHFTREYSKTN